MLVSALVSGEARAVEATSQPHASQATFALIIGVNHSVDAALPELRYADDDAARYQELFRSLGGRTYLLTRPDENTRRISPQAVAEARDPRRAELTVAVASLAADVAQARARGVRASMYLIYAGHGNVAGASAYLALEDARLTESDIEHGIVDKIGADETHLIVDACYSYFLAYGRGPGGTRRELHGFVPSGGLARRADVGLLLSTTSARESHEWEGFQAGVFSHEIRSGLFGAADFDGDGLVSYREIAAFVGRANAAIPNERFRPQVFARPPRDNAQLLDVRSGLQRRLHIEGTARADHYLLEDGRGVRLADFHNAAGHPVDVYLPTGAGVVYLRRASDDQEVRIPAGVVEVALGDLPVTPPRVASRGAAHDAFSLIFALPFDQSAMALETAQRAAVFAIPDGAGGAPEQLDPGGPGTRPRWRTVAGGAAVGVAVVAAAAAMWFTVSARQLSDQAQHAASQSEAAALNDRLSTRRMGVVVTGAVGVGAALSGAALLWWPPGPVRPAGSVQQDLAVLGLAGWF